ncbi:hypothetical protein, partial [Paracidovorax avenae]|uniref:hypothetical protein n=1 Tax=Paracidovorax avenae TaxID=80867 RepID=UPI001CEF785F
RSSCHEGAKHNGSELVSDGSVSRSKPKALGVDWFAKPKIRTHNISPARLIKPQKKEIHGAIFIGACL